MSLTIRNLSPILIIINILSLSQQRQKQQDGDVKSADMSTKEKNSRLILSALCASMAQRTLKKLNLRIDFM